MFGNKRLPAAVFAGGLAALAALVGCEREPSAASKSAAAFREAQKKGETFGGAEHSHGHGAITPGGAAPEAVPSGHDHGEAGAAPDHSAMEHGSEAHAGGHAPRRGEGAAQQGGHGGHARHAGMDQAQGHAAPEGTAGAAEQHNHAGHGATPSQTPPAAQSPSSGHAGHSPSQGPTAPAAAAAAAVPPGQPAATLRPDALDSPAATSVADAQRSAEMTGGGHGGHGGHGAGTYRHVDAGRGPGAYDGSEEQTPGAGGHQHGPATPPSGHEGHSQHEPPAGAAAAYACPMHPEVTSTAPGKCPKCGMELVKRRKG